jgi:CO/xanthine dehydrogenase Mo-binding subunit
MATSWIGAPVRRREDPALLQGAGRFVDDLRVPGCLHAVVVRSPHAHATLGGVDTAAARALPGVLAAFAHADLAPLRPLPVAGAPPPALARRVPIQLRVAEQFPLAAGTVRYVGEPVALLVGPDPYRLADARERVQVAYAPRPALTDVEAALAPGAPLVHPAWGDNVAVAFRAGVGDAERALAAAPVVVRRRLRLARSAGVPLEPRGLLAVPEPDGRGLSVWASTQVPHWLQRVLAEALGLGPEQVRVRTPEVGGGFGTKCSIYPEDVLVPLVAWRLGQPVKWIETRHEHLLAASHSREQWHEVELGATADGRLLALLDRLLLDQGAYTPWGIVQPYNTAAHLPGPFRLPAFAVEARAVVTHKAPHAPYRGAGRPEAVFVMDRIVDALARELGLDPAEVRRRNFVTPAEMPYDVGLLYRDGQPLVYDGGDYPGALAAVLAAVDYEGLRREQPALRARGIHRGVGLSAYVEGTGIGPYEGARVRLDAAGGVQVATGACSQGQGHATTFAQLAAEVLGVRPEDVSVTGGDTAGLPFGIGTFASRSLVLAGNAVSAAAGAVREQVRRAAGRLLEAAPGDIELAGGRAAVRGAPDRALPLAAVVQGSLPGPGAPGTGEALEATVYQPTPTVTYAYAAHAAVVDVDPETGQVQLRRYAVAHDCGRVVNPVIVDGQIHGGVGQGIGGGLGEALVYDGAGQLLTATLMDYALPRAEDLPAIETRHLETPSPRNPLGLRGVGEGGAIGPPAALAAAVEDALAPRGAVITAVPVGPPAVAAALGLARPAP